MTNTPAQLPLAAKVWKAYTDVSAETQQQFIERHLPLVKTAVDRMRVNLPPSLDIDDLYSVGITGLLAAVRKFDPSQSATFAAFATMHIRGAVLDELRRMDWMSRGCREKAKHLKETIAEIEQRIGCPASEEEVCAKLSLTSAEYAELLDEVRPLTFVPLDGEAFNEDSEGICLHEVIRDETQISARDELEKRELLELMIERIQKLPDVPKKVLAMYYFENMRIAEIAAVFGLTEGRISQIHTQAVLSLRSFMDGVLKNSLSPSCC
jgi:RNA polymerase sigma factor for flagellar operon FliA